MSMDFGGSCGIDQGQRVIDSAAGTYRQLQSVGMRSKLGVTAMIGLSIM